MRRILFLILFSFTFTQEIQDTQKSIQKLKEEIADIEEQLGNLNENEDLILDELKALDFQVKASSKKLTVLTKNIQKIQQEIKVKEKNVRDLENDISEIKNSYAQRIVLSYKYPQITEFDLLLNAKESGQFLRFLKYKEYIDKEEIRLEAKFQKNSKLLQKNIENLIRSRRQEESERKSQEQEINELSSRKEKQKKLLSKIKNDIKSYTKAINEKKKEQTKLTKLLETIVNQSDKKNVKNYVLSSDLKKNKGKLPWPVNGKIISSFGKHKHSKYKIYETNNGIDIKADKGQKVMTIYEGIVVSAAYQNGFGNTVIIQHNADFLTVYAHLDEILVNSGDVLRTGQTIGTVGNTGTLDGNEKLHFEIYIQNKLENPVKWLK